MAYRGTVASRAKLFYQHRNRVAPSFSQTHRDDTDSRESPIPRSPESSNYFQHRLRSSFTTLPGPKIPFGDRRFAIPAGCGVVLGRNFSSVGEGAADKIGIPSDTVAAADKIEIPNDTVGALAEKAVEVALDFNQIPMLMTIDSFFPVAALQNLVYSVHVYTGLNWWASIVSTNIFILSLYLPIIIKMHRSGAKLNLASKKMDALREEMGNQDMSPADVAVAKEKLFKEYGVRPYTPFMLFQVLKTSAPILFCFTLAVACLEMKYPSFKEGGIFWFTDLSTPDSTFIFPVLSALTYSIIMKSANLKLRTFDWGIMGALAIHLAFNLPKAAFLPFLTTGVFFLGYIKGIRSPVVEKMLGIPLTPPSTNKGNLKGPEKGKME